MSFLRKLFNRRPKKAASRLTFPPHPNEAKSKEVFDFIKSATPKEVRDWIAFHKSSGTYIYEEHFYAAIDKAASEDDADHLAYLEKADAEEAEEFLKEMKEDCITLSNKVFRKAVQISNTNKARDAVKKIADSSPENVLYWYLKKAETEFFYYLDESVEEYAHLKIKELFSTDSQSNQLLEKIYTYIVRNLPVPDGIQKSSMYLRSLNHRIEKESDNAFVNRLIGEHYESIENYKKALEHFEQAYAIDSKVGVKNKINKYKKLIDLNSPAQTRDK